VVTPAEYDAAFNGNTAMVMYLATDHHSGSDGPGRISFEDTVAVAHRHGVPVLVDAAPELPPFSNLTHFSKLGADLVCFSGGKGLQGPQCSGILTGRRDLIEAAWMNWLGTSDSIGRAMKVGKEEIVGLWSAVERFVRLDHGKQEERWKAVLDRVAKHVRDLEGIEARLVSVDREPPHVPRLYVRWDEKARGLTTQQAIQALAEGEPAIYVRYLDEFGLTVVPVGIQPGEEEIIGRRLREILGSRG
jgi:L-seryl-tRNA(Ser) seleniumtransferase